MLVHWLGLKVRLSFIGHEVHCFNFPSLQVYAEGEKMLKCCQITRVPLLKAVKDETHNLLSATQAS